MFRVGLQCVPAATINMPADGAVFLGRVAVVVSFLLVCAVLGSLAAGVLVAYGVCLAMFGVFRLHARQAAASHQAPAEAVLEG